MLSYCLEGQECTLLKLTDTLHSLEEVHFKMAELIRLHVNAGYFLTTDRGGNPPTESYSVVLCPFNDMFISLVKAFLSKCLVDAFASNYHRYHTQSIQSIIA